MSNYPLKAHFFLLLQCRFSTWILGERQTFKPYILQDWKRSTSFWTKPQGTSPLFTLWNSTCFCSGELRGLWVFPDAHQLSSLFNFYLNHWIIFSWKVKLSYGNMKQRPAASGALGSRGSDQKRWHIDVFCLLLDPCGNNCMKKRSSSRNWPDCKLRRKVLDMCLGRMSLLMGHNI